MNAVLQERTIGRIAQDLRERWSNLAYATLKRHAVAMGDQLIARYAEAHRAYHDLHHLDHVTSLLLAWKADPRLQLAAWFHDAVYMPGTPGNEAKSAALARAELSAHGYDATDADFVAEAVLATASHLTAKPQFAMLIDADLAILASPTVIYQDYAAAIRSEYASLSDEEFARGRSSFLSAMLAQPHIFQTARCRGRYETAARVNLQAELGYLKAQQ